MSAPTPPSDPEVAAEQEALDRALSSLEAMRQRAEKLLQDLVAAGSPDLDYVAALARRVSLLADSPRPLLFGRIDEEDGPTWRIGRRHVEDARSDPVVIDWRAPVSRPFYRASRSQPMGLALRRRFGFSGGELTAFEDERFLAGPPEHPGLGAPGRAEPVSRLLIEEIERPRSGPMRDIVATIQPDQDDIVRADVGQTVCVQGAPAPARPRSACTGWLTCSTRTKSGSPAAGSSSSGPTALSWPTSTTCCLPWASST